MKVCWSYLCIARVLRTLTLICKYVSVALNYLIDTFGRLLSRQLFHVSYSECCGA
jgi:hypothetical protein